MSVSVGADRIIVLSAAAAAADVAGRVAGDFSVTIPRRTSFDCERLSISTRLIDPTVYQMD